MNKILKAIVYILILIFLYLWLSTVFDSCGKQSVETVEETEETLEDILGDDDLTDLTSEQDTEDEFEGEEEEISYEESAQENNTASEEISNDLTEPFNEEEEERVASSPPRFSSDSNAPYLIVAGSFSQENNANNLVDKLRRMGYNNAEKAQFDGSTFYSVIAERHSNMNTARNQANGLKSRGVDCYVHTRK